MEIPRFRSIGEVLYEMTLWLLFYPRTLWRVLLRPAEVGDANAGEGEPDADLVSPPLFLMISILLAHALGLTLRAEFGERFDPLDLGSLIFRVVAFSLLPLVMAVGALRRLGEAVDRQTLRRPFYLQCFYAAPFAVSVSVAIALAGSPAPPVRIAGAALGVAAVAWYLSVETRWLQSRLAVGRLRAFGVALRLFAGALVCCLALALVIFKPGR
uniref:Yip1 domain-containing protein n=1 Tax=Caulobacter sp. (strain K31) TaxID=366602 RepID=B0SUN4_CAUSK